MKDLFKHTTKHLVEEYFPFLQETYADEKERAYQQLCKQYKTFLPEHLQRVVLGKYEKGTLQFIVKTAVEKYEMELHKQTLLSLIQKYFTQMAVQRIFVSFSRRH